jgi:multicomponent Na+:H+ antiporter subunit G
MIDLLGYFLISAGILFEIFGCIALVRFPDVYTRLQGSTKCVNLGTILLLAGVACINGWGIMTTKIIVCIFFIMITMPTAAHAIAKGSYASGIELWQGSVIDKYGQDIEKQQEKK